MKNKNLRVVVAVLSAAVLVTGLCACGGKNAGETENQSGTQTETQEGTAEKVDAADATDLFTKVWDSFDAESEKFAAIGGSVENPVDNAPGQFPVDNAENLDASLGFPTAQVANIDDAASLMHMMNANTFTGAVYHLADSQKQEEVALALKDNIMQRQWLCGAPERMTIWSVGNEYVVCVFGIEQNVSVFKTRLEGIYENAEVLFDESLVEQ